MSGPPRGCILTCQKSRFGRPQDLPYIMEQATIRLGEDLVQVVRPALPTGLGTGPSSGLTIRERVEVRLRSAGCPVTASFLATDLGISKQRVSDALKALKGQGKAESDGDGKGATWTTA